MNDLLLQLCTEGYMRVPCSISAELLLQGEHEFRDLLPKLSQTDKQTCFRQMSANPKDYLGYRSLAKPGRQPDERFQYAPEIEPLMPGHMIIFRNAARDIYDGAVASLSNALGGMESFFPGIHDIFFTPASRCTLRFLYYPPGHTGLLGNHYEHSALTLALHESVSGLHIGLDDMTAKPIGFMEGTAPLLLGTGFEEYVDPRYPLARHFARRDVVDDHARVSMILLAHIPGSVLVDRTSHLGEANRQREYPQNLYEILMVP